MSQTQTLSLQQQNYLIARTTSEALRKTTNEDIATRIAQITNGARDLTEEEYTSLDSEFGEREGQYIELLLLHLEAEKQLIEWGAEMMKNNHPDWPTIAPLFNIKNHQFVHIRKKLIDLIMAIPATM